MTKITQEDRDTLLLLYKKVQVLKRIMQIKSEHGEAISTPDVENLNEAEKELENYWVILADKYNLEVIPNRKWTIDFYNNEIYII